MSVLLDRYSVFRWLWPVAGLIVLAGYFGPWLPHRVAGLVVTGLDLGEYIKFLPSVTEGSVVLWREGFYLPLIAVSLSCSLLAYRDVYRYSIALRFALLLLGLIAALNMLPPAWTPAVLRSDEFQLQTATIIVCIGLLLFSPVLRLLPALPVYALLGTIALAGIWFPITGFIKILPDVNYLYAQEIRPGWGFYVLVLGLALLVGAYWLGLRGERTPHSS